MKKDSIWKLLTLVVGIGLIAACGARLAEDSAVFGEWEEAPDIMARAMAVHDAAWVADTHLDSPLRSRDPEWNPDERHDSSERSGGRWDIPRMIEGGADAVFLAVYQGQGPLTEEGYANVHARAIALFDWIHRIADASPNAELALTSADAERLHRMGKRAIFIGVENGYPIGTDLRNVEDFYNRGMRYMTLSHSGDNQICASSSGPGDREDFGLTDFGRQVVREMNRLGIMIDCSHISDQTFFDVIEMTTAPVIASHSGVDGINEHGRNFSDEMLLKLKENGGSIQLIPLGSFIRGNPERERAMEKLQGEFGDRSNLSQERMAEYRQEMNAIRQKYPTPPATIADYIKHIDYVVNMIGIDHVGFGSDFDGGGGVEGIYDISQLPNLTVELIRSGYSDEDIKKFWGGNLLRVLKAVEAAAGR